jgi:Ca-activated chloride channel homolog
MNAESASDLRTRRHGRRRQRRPWRSGPLRAAATVALVGAGALVTVLLVGRGSGAGGACSAGGRAISVAVAPDLAASVQAAASALNSAGTDSAGHCERVTVTARPAAQVAASLTATNPVRPDVWIPDSSIWVSRAAAEGWVAPRQRPSVALSPVVLAVSKQVAERLGWPRGELDVARLFASTGGSARLALSDPQQSAPSVGGLLAVQNALRSGPGGPAELASVLRGAAMAVPPDSAAALRTLSSEPGTTVPVSEQALWAADSAPTALGAVAVYPQHGMTLDYPFLVLDTSAPAAASAASLLTSLQHGIGHEAVLASGYRDPRTGRGPALRTARGVLPEQPTPTSVPAAGLVRNAIRAQRVLQAPSRVLAVVDVSGSMGTPVPGAGGATRLDLVTGAASRGLALYPDQAEIGLWVFSTHLTATTDYRQLVPIGPLAPRSDGVPGRERLVQALGQVREVPNGATGLYDTTLAAVRAVRRGWDPARANSVVLLTDGRNDDPNGIGLTELVATLRREAAGGNPVPVIAIAYGGDSDVPALDTIARASGGRLYQAQDPRNISAVFLDAIGRRACLARC